MPEGTVKRWNMQKGFGFITPTNPPSTNDVFVHQSALQMDGFRCLCEGEAVKFELTQEEDGRSRASSVTAPDGGKLKGLWADEAHQTGTVARWRADKGFGFITPADGGDDVFVHQSAIHAIGYRSLNVGETVEYAVGSEEGSGRLKASKVTASGGRPVRAHRDQASAVAAVGGRYGAAGALAAGGMFVGAGGLGGIAGLPAAYGPRGAAGAGFGGGYTMGYNGYALNALAGIPPQHLAAVAAAGGYDFPGAQPPGSPRAAGYGLGGLGAYGGGVGQDGSSLAFSPAAAAAAAAAAQAAATAQPGFVAGGVRAGAAFGF